MNDACRSSGKLRIGQDFLVVDIVLSDEKRPDTYPNFLHLDVLIQSDEVAWSVLKLSSADWWQKRSCMPSGGTTTTVWVASNNPTPIQMAAIQNHQPNRIPPEKIFAYMIGFRLQSCVKN